MDELKIFISLLKDEHEKMKVDKRKKEELYENVFKELKKKGVFFEETN